MACTLLSVEAPMNDSHLVSLVLGQSTKIVQQKSTNCQKTADRRFAVTWFAVTFLVGYKRWFEDQQSPLIKFRLPAVSFSQSIWESRVNTIGVLSGRQTKGAEKWFRPRFLRSLVIRWASMGIEDCVTNVWRRVGCQRWMHYIPREQTDEIKTSKDSSIYLWLCRTL